MIFIIAYINPIVYFKYISFILQMNMGRIMFI